jgi:hypothetical protein
MMAIIQADENCNTSRRRVVEPSEWIIAIICELKLYFLHDYTKKKQNIWLIVYKRIRLVICRCRSKIRGMWLADRRDFSIHILTRGVELISFFHWISNKNALILYWSWRKVYFRSTYWNISPACILEIVEIVTTLAPHMPRKPRHEPSLWQLSSGEVLDGVCMVDGNRTYDSVGGNKPCPTL